MKFVIKLCLLMIIRHNNKSLTYRKLFSLAQVILFIAVIFKAF